MGRSDLRKEKKGRGKGEKGGKGEKKGETAKDKPLGGRQQEETLW